MSGKTAFFIELVLVFGGVLAWACWELYSLRRSQAKDRELDCSSAEFARGSEEVHHGEHNGPQRTRRD